MQSPAMNINSCCLSTFSRFLPVPGQQQLGCADRSSILFRKGESRGFGAFTSVSLGRGVMRGHYTAGVSVIAVCLAGGHSPNPVDQKVLVKGQLTPPVPSSPVHPILQRKSPGPLTLSQLPAGVANLPVPQTCNYLTQYYQANSS